MECNGVYTTMTYLSNDPLYDVEKPYACAFPIEDMPGAQASNYIFEKGVFSSATFEGNLCMIWTSPSSRSSTPKQLSSRKDFESYNFVREQYFKELEQLILRLFPQYSKVIYMDHNVCLLPFFESRFRLTD